MTNHKRIKICHLGKYYPPAPGGMETHVQTLARTQALLGADVSVVCVDHLDRSTGTAAGGLNAGTAPLDGLRKLNAHCDGDGSVRVVRLPPRISLNRFDVCPGLPRVLRAMADEGVDLYHLHTPNPTMLMALAMAAPEAPLVITHHSDIIRQKVLRFVLRPLERLVYSRAAQIYTTSSVYLSGSAFLSRYSDRVQALPLGVNLSPYLRPSDASREHALALKRAHGAPLWLTVGRLVYYKGLHVALEALSRVPGTLMIVGTGPLEGRLKLMAREFGVEDRVSWHGYVNDEQLIGAYLAADALWFPSNARSEAFGLVQVEAMASGCPVINTHIPGSGVSWVSRDDESGITIPPNDPKALAAAALRILEDPGWRERLSLGARNRVQEEFDHMVMARRSLASYHSILRNVRPRSHFAKSARVGGPGPAEAIDADNHVTQVV